jgi:periplasmic protein TonB
MESLVFGVIWAITPEHMKQCLPVLFLSFICTLCLSTNGAAQDSSVSKTKAAPEEEWDKNYKREIFDGYFPGGDSAWRKYIEKNLVYPKRAKRKKIEGIVTVHFILTKEGIPVDAKALSGPEELRQSALDVVMKSPKWWPAIQSGRQVKAYKKRDIVFKLPTE